jgi:peptidyl-prolyl cis-trans isomerase D
VEPSSETYQKKYAEAVKFAGVNNTYDKFNAAISKENLTKRYASDITEAQRTITGLESPRALIRWAFDAELHDVAGEIFEFGNKYVVATLSSVREKGVAPLDQVSSEIKLEVEKIKKAELLAEEFSANLKDAQSIFELGEKMGLIVQEATNVSFNSVSLPNAGIEPSIISAAGSLEVDQFSVPVTGNNGVYVLFVNSVQDTEESDLAQVKSRMTTMRESQANFEAYDALRKAANIKDNRSTFF